MAVDHATPVQLLQQLERHLIERERRVEGLLIGRIARRVEQSADVRGTLDELGAVEGFGPFVLRLLWLAHPSDVTSPPERSPELKEFQLQELTRLLPPLRTKSPAVGAPDSPSDAVRDFGHAVEGLQRRSSPDGHFRGVDFGALAIVDGAVTRLLVAARGEGKKDIADFAEACAAFCRFVREEGLAHDVRCINLLDNAHLTLQTVIDAGSADDYDSLRQTIALLRNPENVFA
jgi:hypothetical protein